jgi:glycine/D-amino acid oxidase-like deaminating enzyme
VNPDVIVVGAGIVGAAVADVLAAEGMKVLVVERAFAAAGATGAGMGHIVVLDDSPAQLALCAWSRRLLLELAPQLPDRCETERCGTLWVAENDAQLEVARTRADVLAQAGVTASLLDARTLADVEPALRAGLAGALLVPDDAVIYPPALCAFLLQRAVRAGASVLQATAVRSLTARTVTTDGRVLHARFVVNAAGVGAAQLSPELPVIPRKGHLVITERHPGTCRHQLVELGYMQSAHAVTGSSVAFNVQPRRTGQLLIGSSRERVGLDASINRDIIRTMLLRAIAFMPGLGELTALRSWVGFRPATPDGLPCIGRTRTGVWAAAGHEGLGITTALATAQLLAALMLERATHIDAAPFAPDRALPAA